MRNDRPLKLLIGILGEMINFLIVIVGTFTHQQQQQRHVVQHSASKSRGCQQFCHCVRWQERVNQDSEDLRMRKLAGEHGLWGTCWLGTLS